MNLDQLMSASLDDLADLPTFEAPPNGSYRLDLTVEAKKKDDGKDVVVFKYIVDACVEQANAAEQPAEIGQLFQEQFQISNDVGAGFFKLNAAVLMPAIGASNFAEFFEKAKGLKVFGVVKQRKVESKEAGEPPRIYASVSNLQVL